MLSVPGKNPCKPYATTGAFVGPDGKTLAVPEGLPNAHMRLFGGAQYHRAMAEFRASIGELTCPDIRCCLSARATPILAACRKKTLTMHA